MPSPHIVLDLVDDVPAAGRTQGNYRFRVLSAAFNILLDVSVPDPFVPLPALPVGDYTLLGQPFDAAGEAIGGEVSAPYSHTGDPVGPTLKRAAGIGVQML